MEPLKKDALQIIAQGFLSIELQFNKEAYSSKGHESLREKQFNLIIDAATGNLSTANADKISNYLMQKLLSEKHIPTVYLDS